MELFAVVVTIVAGFLGAGLLGNWLNWPDAGAVVAVAVMGDSFCGKCAVKKRSKLCKTSPQ